VSENREEQQEQEPQAQQDFPGKRLAEAREAAGLSRTELAAQLRLNERMVIALEEDDYDAFPSAAFVTGYLRSYARILGLHEEDFVRPVTDSTEPPALVSTIGSKEQASSRDLPVRMVTYLLVIAVIVSVAMWWLAQRDGSDTTPLDAREEVTDADGNIGLSLPEAELAAEQPEDAAAGLSEEAGDAGDGADEGQGSVGQTANEAKPTPSVVDETETGSVEAEPQSTSAETLQPGSGETDEASAEQETPPPLTDAMPKSKLEIRYQADSWTEVNDNAGRNLVYGLIKAGQTLELRGEAPFRVFLGYAPGVTVYYNGDLFDHSPFQRRDVARFRVGRAEHNLPGPR
jgi:cytoskeleton protein RodZ